jgi:hypothetical protein
MKRYTNKKGSMIQALEGKWCSFEDALDYGRSERTYERDKAWEQLRFIVSCVAEGNFKVDKKGGVRFGKTKKKKRL